MAGLNFVGNLAYADVKPDVTNVAQFEFIPWILSQCASVTEVRELLAHMNLTNTPFSEQFPHKRGFTGSSGKTASIIRIHCRRSAYLRQSGRCAHK